MTHVMHLDTIIADLGAISVANVTVCTLQTLPVSPDLSLSYLIPSPSDPAFMTGFRTDNVSFGQKTAQLDAYYRLNYKLLYAPIGSARGLNDILPGMMDVAITLFAAILELDALTGAVSWDASIGENVVVVDPAGVQWHAVGIGVDIHEFIQ
jgi:hypothetical protein